MTDARSADPAAVPLVRRLGQLVETLHAVVYFAPEAGTAYREVGCRGWWMGYFASRSAALGRVGPAAVAAMFHGFAPSFVARSLPDAWEYADPEAVLGARLSVAGAALTRALGPAAHSAAVEEAADLLSAVVPLLPGGGRPLFAAHAVLPVPSPAYLALWHAATCLREFRGDGHVAVLLGAGLDGVEANALAAGVGLVDAAAQPSVRGWSPEQWADGVAALAERGLVGPDGVATAEGDALRAALEDRTDAVAAPVTDVLGAGGAVRVADLLAPLAAAVAASGAVPYPNPMGLPPVG